MTTERIVTCAVRITPLLQLLLLRLLLPTTAAATAAAATTTAAAVAAAAIIILMKKAGPRPLAGATTIGSRTRTTMRQAKGAV